MLVYRDTLTEALPLRERPGAIGLVLSLEGARYYVFISRQSREQVANSAVGSKLKLHAQLLKRTLTADQHQEKYRSMLPVAQDLVAQRQVDVESRHAEELLIEHFDECVQNFVSLRGRPPAKAEVFLSHCPCQSKDPGASPARMLAGSFYEATCKAKLMKFCTTGTRAAISWKVYYQFDIGSSKLEINENLNNLTMCKQPAFINT
ncbi:hypothetical protein RGV33_07755 [Pseudomonas sp. Bout1]|uniref:hypothetical protein n=1 Tax=Pseudomonas sp. Bout1 TaxID=3048600 RepID=UPI002AB58B70|nr:hypothetical protein [Pseudomonas sp. Bout1]MDY7531571.1 hypothetical protein [Pseudomonas sp. Bout1]MEB0184957.1 hypothetical protein [Pseudomonas sp. Bout1]